MNKFARDFKIARILSAIGVGVNTYFFLRLSSIGLSDQARLVLAVLGYAGYLCSMLACHRLGILSGFDCAIDKLLERGLVDMERWHQQRQAAAQRGAKEKSQDSRGDGG